MKEAWVTYASNGDEAQAAVVLARSLEGTLTRRNIAILISPQLSRYSSSSVEALEREFHFVKRIPQDTCTELAHHPFSTIAWIYSLSLTQWNKIVFLDCKLLVLRNSDDIFRIGGEWVKPDDGEQLINESDAIRNLPSLLVQKPGISSFIGLLDNAKAIASKREVEKTRLSRTLWNYNENLIASLDRLNPGSLTGNICDTRIVYFANTTRACDILDDYGQRNNYNSLEQEILAYYYQLREKNLDAQKDPMISNQDELKDSVAIVGMSMRLPGANSIEELWTLLISGNEGIVKVPEGRWDERQCFTMVENTRETEAGFLKCSVDDIDAKFFGLSPKEVELMDPQQRLVLGVMHESLEHACINPVSLKGTQTGIFGGWWRNDFKEILQEAGGLQSKEFFRTYMGNTLGTLTSRISHVLDTTGPSVATESGCSTSIVAVDMACKSLLNEDCELGLAFGVNLLLHPFHINAINSVIAPDGRCKTFDEKADGFGRAEGCTFLVLKRYPDALRDGDRIWGIIRGTAVVQDGMSGSLGTPTVKSEALAMKLALEKAGVEPREVSFVETHGTGTVVGDPLEVAAIREVYGSTEREKKLIIGSVKTNIGHTESCSGISGIIKTVLCLQNEVIPKHLNFEKLNSDIDLDSIPAELPLAPMEWKRTKGIPRFAGVSSFGITGTNAHAIIQETPDVDGNFVNWNSPHPKHFMKLSAKCPTALDEWKTQMQSFLSNEDTHIENLDDIVFSANTGRGDYPHRSFVIGSDRAEIMQNLNKSMNSCPGQTPKLCLLFTGQGSQYPGMANSLYQNSQLFRMNFDRCEKLLQERFSISIKDALWGDATHLLKRSLYSQTSIFCVEYCLTELWKSWGVKPDCVLGHSLGEFAAAVAGGIISLEDALTLVGTRSKLIDALPGGKMLVVREGKETVFELLKRFENTREGVWLDLAAVNAPDQTVLAGGEENVMQFDEICRNNGIKTHILDASHAFHSRHMDPMLDAYGDVAKTLSYSQPRCTFISGMEGRTMGEAEVTAEFWVQHTRKPVQFLEASKAALLDSGCNIFLEIGPHPVLSALVMINADAIDSPSSLACFPSMRRNEDEWTILLNSLGKLYGSGLKIKWEGFHQFSKGKKVTLPYYPFQKRKFEFAVEIEKPRPFHPLVGSQIPNPTETKIFHNTLDVDITPFLKDHVIGSNCLFPGAGFLEMCLVAGYAGHQCLEGSYQPPANPITILDFQIEAPMALQEGQGKSVQVLTSGDSGEPQVSVHSRLNLGENTTKWIKQASGTFSPFAQISKDEETVLNSVDLQSAMANCSKKIEIGDNTYESLAKHGYKFGPTFQTLREGWRNPEVSGNVLCKGFTECLSNAYVLHPVVMDAMFQSIMISTVPETKTADDNKNKKIFVPVSIEKFVWYGSLQSNDFFILCFVHADQTIVILFNAEGKKIAAMIGALLIETTLSSILINLDSQRSALPPMHEETWKPQLGPNELRIPPKVLEVEPSLRTTELHGPSVAKYNDVSDKILEFYRKSNDLYLCYMIKALRVLGWDMETHRGTFTLGEIQTKLSIKPDLDKFFRYILLELVEEGYLEQLSDDPRNLSRMEFKVEKPLPLLKVVVQQLQLMLKDEILQVAEVWYVSQVGEHLASILQGSRSVLPILFPENLKEGEMGPAAGYYMESQLAHHTHTLTSVLAEPYCRQANEYIKESKGGFVVRVLEIGAGTGSFTRNMLPHFTSDETCYEYTYTDISAVFFAKAEEIFKERPKLRRIFKTLNIEVDPLTQGFMPQHYDLIVASFVLHATKDMQETLGNVRKLLAPNGTVIITDSTKPLRPINLLFGAVEGFSRFSDYDLRPHYNEMAADVWKKTILHCGFEGVVAYPIYLGHAHFLACFNSSRTDDLVQTTMIAGTIPSPKPTWMLFANNTENVNFFRSKLSDGLGKNLILIQSNEAAYIESRSRCQTFYVRSDEPADMHSSFAAAIPNDGSIQLEGIIFLWGLEAGVNGSDAEYRNYVLPFLTLCRILLQHTFPLNQMTPRLIVVTLKQKVFTDGDVGESPFTSILCGMSKALQNETPTIFCKSIDMSEPKELECVYKEIFFDDNEPNVAYRGNRRHVLRAVPFKPDTNVKTLPIPKTERYRLFLPSTNAIADLRFGPSDAKQLGDHEVEIRIKAYSLNFRDVLVVLKPSEEFENIGAVGFDFSGVVDAVGPKVTKRKVGDEVIGFNQHGDSLASHLTADEDLLLPVPSNLTLEDAAAIPAVFATSYVCLMKVAKITKDDTVLIHTGSGGVGVCAIKFAQRVGCKVVTTAGTARKRAFLRNLGVEYVFNSRNTQYGHDIREALGGQGVDVVLNSLTSEGFKEATLAACNPGARFVEMSKLNIWKNEEVAALRPDVKYEIVDLSKPTKEEMLDYLDQVKAYTEETQLKALPYVRFQAEDIRGALTFLQKAKHIGKIVCVMPEPVGSSGTNGWKSNCFNDKSTYLITGGLGGIGLEVAKWMVGSGAKHVVLVGRNPPSDYAKTVIDALNSTEKGGNVLTIQCDVGDYNQCKALLEEISRPERNLPMLRGIMHAAGVLSDGSFDTQTWEKYMMAYNPKVNGGWNLHQLTLDYPLQHFVMYSSMAAVVGSIGQSNHCSANCFLDALTYYRHSRGLPASTINWGQWGQTGVAVNLEISWVKPFSTVQAISALEVALRGQQVQVAVCEADVTTSRKLFPGCRRYLEDLKAARDTKKTFATEADGEAFWREYDATDGAENKRNLVKIYIGKVIRKILRLEDTDELDPNANFQDLGMDSLMLIEMKNNVQTIMGSRAKISIGTLKDCKTINQVSTRLVELISGEENVPPPTRDELQMLIREDALLNENIIPPDQGMEELCRASQIKTVLVTGVTGNFGPFMLREIAKRPHIEKIYCLIRQTVNASPTERLEKVLIDKKLDTDLLSGKLVCVRGNVTEDKLGMDGSTYERLVTEVDAIYNLAVRADIHDYYRKARPSDRDSRTVNVHGTVRVLEFACAKKLKHVFHASTIGAGNRVDEEDYFAEDWPNIQDFDHVPNMAYPISKFICDLLLAQAVERGIPCKVFRFPYMGVDSQTGGGIDVLGSHLMLRMLAYLYVGAMPAAAVPFTILPIDICADIGTRLAFDDNAEVGIYNVVNPFANDEQELEDFAGEEFGHPVEVVEPDDFLERLDKMENTDIMSMAKYTTRRSDDSREQVENHLPVVGEVWLRKKDIFWSKKLQALLPDYPDFCQSSLELLKRDLRFAKETGVFEKAGLK